MFARCHQVLRSEANRIKRCDASRRFNFSHVMEFLQLHIKKLLVMRFIIVDLGSFSLPLIDDLEVELSNGTEHSEAASSD